VRRASEMNGTRKLLAGIGLDLPPLEPGAEGDPGLFGPGSTVWRVARERVLLVAGPAALLLQLAHPLVAAGVAAHSGFRNDPFQRLRATLDATLRVTFVDREQARSAAEGVRRVHEGVHGRLPHSVGQYAAGTLYDARDPTLALWVYATLIATSVDAHERFVRGLGGAALERHYQQARPFARLFGVTEDVLPPDRSAFDRYYQSMVAGQALSVGPEAAALAAQVLAPPLPRWLRISLPMIRAVTADLLPQRIAAWFGLAQRDTARGRTLQRGLRTAVRAAPPPVRYWPHYGIARARVRGTP
jgi:uncharacterized protein (DUF2236 family)